jgi:glycosyltransferase involved in cell wall biosynthesis
MKKNKISIIMAVYNPSISHLEKSIQSILNQTYQNLEFIIINDASNKRISEKLKRCQEKNPQVKIITNKNNIGLTKSLNKGIKKATGEYIARMDDDDISNKDRLEKQLDYLGKHNLDLISSNCDFIDQKEKFIKEKRNSLPENIKKALFKGNFFTHSSFFGTKKVFLELYNEEYKQAQDYEFLIRIVSRKYKIGIHPENLLRYRINAEGISSKKAKKQEWHALKARLLAITKYNYPKHYLIYFLWPLISFTIPYKIKKALTLKILK